MEMAEGPGDLWTKTVVAANAGPLTLDGTRTYVLGPPPLVVIDPGPALADHLDAVEVALGDADVGAILITHHHSDHAAGAADLRLRTAAPLAATTESAERAGLDAPELPLEADGELEFGGGRLEVVAAPGHCADHVCIYWPGARALFAGDVILGEGTSLVAPPEGDMAAYLSTLERLQQLDLRVIYPGHGPPCERPQEKLTEYLEHRRQREAQVIEALSTGAFTLDQIRARVYPDLDPRLHRAAEGSILAHLAKLINDGRVTEGNGGFVLA